MNKKNTTLLVVGDYKDWDTYRKIVRQRISFYNTDITFCRMSYNKLIENDFPKIKTKKIIVFLCFPFEYWDKKIEPKNYKGVYGNKTFYLKFVEFWKDIRKNIDREYKDRKIEYINHPENLATDRDKIKTKKLVAKKGVDIPKDYKTRNADEIIRLINNGKKIFIKVRFGSMGKGISYFEKGRWMTNFRFKAGKIVSRRSDYAWTFVDVTGKKDFLKELMKQDIIIEDAIEPLIVKNMKFDIRLYTYKDKILYYYCRGNNKEAPTTNISQGGRGLKKSFKESLPKKQVALSAKYAKLSLKALGLKFGGVDIMLCSDKKNAKFIEVNAFPGLPKARKFNLVKHLYEHMIDDYGKRYKVKK